MEAGLALYDPARHAPLAYQLGQDFGVAGHCFLAETLFCLGFPAEAREQKDLAIENARALSHANTLRFDRSLAVSSGYRTPDYNAAVSSTGTDGPHTTGRAVDVRVRGADALELVQIANEFGFTGIGISQRGDQASRFVHLDDLENGESCPRPWIWSY